MRLCDKKRLAHVIKSIYEIYRPHIGKKGRQPKFTSATVFDKVKGSKSTRVKARKCLGIKAQKIAGTWRWPFPTRTLEQALEYAGLHYIRSTSAQLRIAVSKEEKYEHTLAVIQECMEHFNYEARVEEVNCFCRARKVHRTGNMFSRARQELKIKSVSVILGNNSEWHWLWAGPEVTEWVEHLVEANAPINREKVYEIALNERGWSHHLMRYAYEILGLPQYRKGMQVYWTDADHWPEFMIEREKGISSPIITAAGTKAKETCDFLTQILSSGPVHIKKIFEEARSVGISRISLLVAKTTLNIKITKDSSGNWLWSL